MIVGNPASVEGNLTLATGDVDQIPSNGALGDGCSGKLVFGSEPGLWYTFQGTGGPVWPTTCLEGSSSTDIAVYKGRCGSFTCVAGVERPCNDQERFVVLTEVGSTYYVLVTAPLSGRQAFQIQIRNALPPPSNDVCVAAQPLSFGTSVMGNISFATSDELEVLNKNSCYSPGFSLGADEPGLWYTFVGTGGRVWPNVCFVNSIDTYISVYQGTCGTETLQCVTGTNVPSSQKFTFATIAGQTYFMLMRSSSFLSFRPDSRTFELLLSTVPSTVVTADTCSQSTPISIGTTLKGNLTLATPDGGEVATDCLAGNPIVGPGVWYSLDGINTNVTADTCARPTLDTHISIYKGSCGRTNLECIKGTYDPCTIPKFTFATVVGVKYYINVRSSTAVFNPKTFDLVLYVEGKAVAMTPTKSPAMAPIRAAPTPLAPTPIASIPTAPTPVVPLPTAPTPASAILSAPKTPMMAPASTPVVAPAPAIAPSAPSPMAAPTEPCGLLGLRLFCLTGCGLLGRLLKLCQE